MTADRAKLLTPIAVKSERVDLPEFGEGEYVMIHGLTAREYNRYQASLLNREFGMDRRKVLEQKERLLVRCIRDDEGSRIFSDEDVEALGEWPAEIQERVHEVALRLCGRMTEDEDTVGNLPETTAA